MTTVQLYKAYFPIQFKHNDHVLDGIEYKYGSGKRLYFTGMKGNWRMCEVIKVMSFKDGKVFVSFGKDKLEIGEYTS